MIQNYLIIIPFNISYNWTTDYTNQTAKILSQNNTIICFLWEDALSVKEHLQKIKPLKLITKLNPNLFLFHPIHLIPFKRFKFITTLNLTINSLMLKIISNFLARKRKLIKKIIWCFDSQSLSLVKKFNQNFLSIYDCIDYYSNIQENQLIKTVNIMTVNSKTLLNLHRHKRKKIYLVPQGFRLKNFKPLFLKTKHHFKKPTIGYIGGINNRLNFSLLFRLIKNNPNWHFIFWGPKQNNLFKSKNIQTQINQLFHFPNVTFGQSINKKKLSSIISQFDIGIIPYNTSQTFNRYCYPMKIFEYFYMGKPVISTLIPELKQFSKFVKIGNTPKQWQQHIKTLLQKPWPKKYKKEQKKLAEKNSWVNKLTTISQLIDQFFKTSV